MASYHNLKRGTGNNFVSQSSHALRSNTSKHGGIRSKKKKVTQSALAKRLQHRVVDESGIDKTPKLLHYPEYQVLEEWQPTVLDYVEADLVSSGSQTSFFKNFQSNALSLGSHNISLQMSFMNIANIDSYRDGSKHIEGASGVYALSDEYLTDVPPSAFNLKFVPTREFYPPHSKVPLKCNETESMTFFSMNSIIDCITTPEGRQTEESNAYYEYITEGRGKYSRKISISEQQTAIQTYHSQNSNLGRIARKNNSTLVTIWKIYDENTGLEDDVKRDLHLVPTSEQWLRLEQTERFIMKCLIMERILGYATYRDTQLLYKSGMPSDPYDVNIKFLYAVKPLWTYWTNKVEDRAVSAISVNPVFPDIIAVGYGKFNYKEPNKGYVCIWNVKNLKNPERLYWFNSPVTCLDFAVWSPNILAVGFLDGSLLVLDVTSIEKKILFRKDSKACETYEAVIFVKWWICSNIYGRKEERLMMTTADGRIIQLRRRGDLLVPFQMMRTSRGEGKLKGISCLKSCDVEEISMVRFTAARSVVLYPADEQFYLVSAEDGTVHKCSINYFSRHVDLFLAHIGPVYALKFSPFCNRIFLTCGADGAVRLWAWDIMEPLITLATGPVAVVDASWSPKNSTIIMSISGPCLYIWDLTRKTYFPAATHYHPQNSDFTTLQFSETGDNIILGDADGSVLVQALVGMPFDQIFKEEALAASIEKELVVKPKLLKLLKKSGPPFSR